jgi:hypothetical protein
LLEKYLIEHCAPTLASLKTANLFRMPLEPGEDFARQMTGWNEALGGKGVSLLVLRRWDEGALIYVCRKKKLQKDLEKPGVAEFLKGYGYRSIQVEYTLERLAGRLSRDGAFPHEIGIFLGYPLGDVQGYIENAGKNSKCSGCWKVYCNECEAMRTFAKFRKCKRVYQRLWSQGRSVWQLTAAA